MDHNIFIARHPIFDKLNRIYSYEILFRAGSSGNQFNHANGDEASRSVLNRVFMDFGLDKVTNNKFAFINFTLNLLMDDAILILPRDKVILEILETIEPTDELYKRCRYLKECGFKLALDDYQYDPSWNRFVKIVDYIKVDFLLVKGIDRKNILSRIRRDQLKVIAEKVESYQDYEEAKSYGYDYFQGYYFCKPSMLSTQKIAENKVNYIQIIREINNPDFEYSTLEIYIKRDLSLTYKLLKFINSSYFGFKTEVGSVRNALTLLGLKEIKKWITLIAMDSLIGDKPQELIRVSLTRALFCEAIFSLSQKNQDRETFFLMGLLSLLDAILDKNREDVLKEIKINQVLKDTLMGQETSMTPYLEMIIALEQDDFEKMASIRQSIDITLDVIMETYLNSVSISDALLNQI